MTQSLLDRLRQAAGEQTTVTDDWHERMAAARDCWPWLQLGARAGELTPVMPTAVVRPRTVDEVQRLVRAIRSAGATVLPWGGGSAVTGAGLSTDERPAVVLDLKALRSLDLRWADQGLAHVGAGWMGTHLEEALRSAGFTLGHFPSSIHCSTVGGWLATRSAGQLSTRHGKIEDMVVSLRFVDGEGNLRTTAPLEGDDVTGLLVGSEGSFGVIVDAWLQVSPVPKGVRARGFLSADMGGALAAMQEVLQSGQRPAVLRLYDPFDTAISSARSSSQTAFSEEPRALDLAFEDAPTSLLTLLQGSGLQWGNKLLSRLGGAPALLRRASSLALKECLLIASVEEEDEAWADAAAEELFGTLGATLKDLGPAPGVYWYGHRHDVSWKQSPLLQAGLFVDTMEVSTSWDRVVEVYEGVRSAVSPWAFSMAHFSHAYASGSSLYFTFVGFSREVEEARMAYRSTWRAALDAAARCGASSTHHHGAGILKGDRRYQDHHGAHPLHARFASLCDPAEVLNPGKWTDTEIPWPQ